MKCGIRSRKAVAPGDTAMTRRSADSARGWQQGQFPGWHLGRGGDSPQFEEAHLPHAVGGGRTDSPRWQMNLEPRKTKRSTRMREPCAASDDARDARRSAQHVEQREATRAKRRCREATGPREGPTQQATSI